MYSFVNKTRKRLNNFQFIFLLVYSLLGVFILIGLLIHFKKEKSNSELSLEHIKLNELTVLIPYRNEALNLDKLIKSIEKQTALPFQILFIDDHSTDNGRNEIEKLNNSIPYQIINLPDKIQGKKAAIRFGIQSSRTDYLLTLDADVEFDSTYFSSLQKNEKADMLILPVIMQGKGVKQTFFELDYSISNAINTAISSLKRPFIASGANLLFKKDSFLKFDNYDSHKEIASGDDVFLLHDFQKNNCQVRIITSNSNAVFTETPLTINSFLHQRLRWISKGNKVKDQLSNSLAFIAGLSHLIFTILVILLISNKEWLELLEFIFIKSIIEIIIYFPYFKQIDRQKTLLFIPLSTIIYPFYILTLIILPLFIEIKWKDRTI